MNRIFYECKDVSHPSGGVRRLFRHVEILNRNGFSAYILHRIPDFRPTWLEMNVPIVYWTEKLKFGRDDVLVVPEGHTDVIIRTTDAEYERVVIALNWANTASIDIQLGRLTPLRPLATKLIHQTLGRTL